MSTVYPPNPNPERRVAEFITESNGPLSPSIRVTVEYMWDRKKNDFAGALEKTVKITVRPNGSTLSSEYVQLDNTREINSTGLNGKGFLEFKIGVVVPIGDIKAKLTVKAAEASFSGPTYVLNLMVHGALDGDAHSVEGYSYRMKPRVSH